MRYLIILLTLAVCGVSYAQTYENFFYNEDGSRYSATIEPEMIYMVPRKVMSRDSAARNLSAALPGYKVQIADRLPAGNKGFLAVTDKPITPPVFAGLRNATNQDALYFPVYSLGGRNYIIPTTQAIVKLKEGGKIEEIEPLLKKFGAKIADRLDNGMGTQLLLQLPDNADTFAFAREAHQTGLLAFAQPDLIRRVVLNFKPNDTYYPNQWHLNNTGQNGAKAGNDIKAESAWDITQGDPEVYVALIDDGIDWKHEDFDGKVKHKYDYLDNDSDPTPVPGTNPIRGQPVGHGTGVGGIMAAAGNNGIGVSGVCPKCSIIGVRLIGTSSSGGWVTDWTFSQAFNFCVSKGAAVINNSYGPDMGDPLKSGDEPRNPIMPSSTMKNAILDAVRNGRGGVGTSVVFAAGNSNADVYLDGTARMAEVVAVAASTDQGDRSYYSNYGKEISVNAPSSGLGYGYDNAKTTGIWTTDDTGSGGYNTGYSGDRAGNYYNGFGGTSASAPVVSGLIGLIVAANPKLKPAAIKEILQDTAVKIGQSNGKYDSNGHSIYYGYGRVNAEAALMTAIGETCFPREEVCDGRDNNCNGLIDEGDVCIGYAHFCQECAEDKNCASQGAMCVEGQTPSKYCSMACNPDKNNCPPGSSCKSVKGTFQCIANYDSCDSLLPPEELVCYKCTGYQEMECGEGGACLVDSNGRPGCAVPCNEDRTCGKSDQSCFDIQDAAGKSYGYFCFPTSQRCSGNPPSGGGKLCERCVSHAECGGNSDMCINYGTPIEPDGYCGRDCSVTACPPGYTCADIPLKSGKYGKQCLPASQVCLESGFAEWGCKNGKCVYLDEGAGAACLPSNFNKQPTGSRGKLFGECNADLTCEEGTCVISGAVGSKPLCLNTNCLPEVEKKDDKRQFDALTAGCEPGEECIQAVIGDFNTWLCVPTSNKEMISNWGKEGESGGQCDSKDSCDGAFCLEALTDPSYKACFNRCDPSGKLPGEGDPCRNQCDGKNLICAPTKPKPTCVVGCDPSKMFCSDGRLCNDLGNGVGFCSDEEYIPPEDGGTDDDDDNDNNDDGGSETPDVPASKPDAGTKDSGAKADDDDDDDDDNDDEKKNEPSGCGCRVR